MLPVDDIPVIVHIIRWLKLFGITEIGINLHYMGYTISDYLDKGSRLGVQIEYSQER